MTDTFHDLMDNTILLDGVLYPTKGVVGYENLARIENRIVTGNPSKDDDQLLSTKVWDDFSGGCGIFDEKEGSDTGTFWDAEGLDIDHPGQLALGPNVQSFTISGTNAFVLGESGNKVHVSFDKNIYAFTEATDTFADTAYDLGFDPVNKSVLFNGKLWVPQGANGYQTFISGSGVTAGTVGITAVAFVIWDNKLACIETDGQLSWWNPLTAAWSSPTTAILESSQTPKDIVVYYSRSDEPSLYVQTTEALWGYDDVSQIFVRTNVILPKHPDNGKGIAVWRTGETLYIPQSLFVWAWTGPGGTFSPGGPGVKQGIPRAYQGAIVQLTPTLNHLYALIDASSTGSYHSLYRSNGMGWTRMWANANKTDSINWSMNTGVASVQRIWWDAGNKIYSMELPRVPTMPREVITNSAGNYATTGYLITSWFDANMQAFKKLSIYAYANMIFSEFNAVPSYYSIASMDYQVALTGADTYPGTWTNILAIEQSGLNYNFCNFSQYQIRFRILLTATGYPSTGAQTKSPLMDSLVLKYMTIPTNEATFRVTFDLDFEGMFQNRDAQKIAHDLTTLVAKDTLILLEHNQNQYYVRVSNEAGYDETAESRKKSRTHTFVQVNYPGPSGPYIL